MAKTSKVEVDRSPKVDAFFARTKGWADEMRALRELVLPTGLAEDLKWGVPCYSLEGRNVVLIHAFKDYCALLFFKGALLKDPKALLVQQTENVQSSRQLRFSAAAQIQKMTPVILNFLKQAIEAERAGRKVALKTTRQFAVPEEFKNQLEASTELQLAFESLTPGRQRAYLLFFSSAVQAKTREARIQKCLPQIMQGKGLDD